MSTRNRRTGLAPKERLLTGCVAGWAAVPADGAVEYVAIDLTNWSPTRHETSAVNRELHRRHRPSTSKGGQGKGSERPDALTTNGALHTGF